MYYEYKSRKLNKTFDFSAPNSGGYVRLDGRQICYGGSFFGNTIWVNNEEEFKKIVRKWMKDYIKSFDF